MQWRGQPWCSDTQFARVVQGQWQTQQHVLRVGADFIHQAQGFPVGADPDVLAIVERDAVGRHSARPATEYARGLEDRDGNVTRGEFCGGGHAGITTADDGDARFRLQRSPRTFYLSRR